MSSTVLCTTCGALSLPCRCTDVFQHYNKVVNPPTEIPNTKKHLSPTEREKLAEDIACYFAGYSFSRHEWKQCLGLVDVLLVRGYEIQPPKQPTSRSEQ